jgi:drug/metabolite transporter (DMT)-like permease
MIGIALGLGAALGWGLADYVAAIASRRVGAMWNVLGMHVTSVFVMLVVAGAKGELFHIPVSHLPQFALLGAVSAVAFVALYQALSIGPLSIVSPIVSAYAAVTVILAVVVLGERLNVVQGLAIGATIAGIVLASSRLQKVRLERGSALGIGLGFVAMIGLGILTYQIGAYERDFGWVRPLLVTRIFASAFIAVLMLAARRRRSWAAPRRAPRRRLRPALLAVAVLGALDTAGWFLFNLGVAHSKVSLVGAASAWYPLVPVVFAFVLLEERPSRNQWAGIALILFGLTMLGAAS